eukprot:11348970-Prorocentrum_lima.AAC.1
MGEIRQAATVVSVAATSDAAGFVPACEKEPGLECPAAAQSDVRFGNGAETMEAAKDDLAVQATSSPFATDDALTVGRDICAAPLDTGD